jgi:nucleoside-diphosphate-sugar epimerase
MMRDPVYSAVRPLVAPDEVGRWMPDIARRPVAVTGGTGFVGSHLVDTLCAAGVRPRVLIRDADHPRWIADRDVDWVAGDLDDHGAVRELVADAGTVFHLAGRVRASRASQFDRVNRVGTEALVEAVASEPEVVLVHVSSQAALGPSPEVDGRGVDDPPAPVSAYGRSKRAAEEAVRALGSGHRWTIVRPPAIYGPRDIDVFEFFRWAARGVVPVPAGERWLTVAWVGDVICGLLAAAGTSERTVHLGAPEPRRLDELVDAVGRTGGRVPRLVRVPPPVVRAAGALGWVAHGVGAVRTAMTPDKAVELLARHWTLETGPSLACLEVGAPLELEEGLRRTWSWYRTIGWI